MNGLSLSELCGLFCCPPFPSRIAAKLAFLPPEPSYRLIPDESGAKFSLELNERAEWQYTDREKENIEVFCTRTSRGNRIACMYVRCTSNNRFTILFSHGNAVDLGQMSSFYVGLGSRINCNIFSYDYSGKVNYIIRIQKWSVLIFQAPCFSRCNSAADSYFKMFYPLRYLFSLCYFI